MDGRARYVTELVTAAEQGLLDLAAAMGAEVSFVRHEDPGPRGAFASYVDELTKRAGVRGFVTSRVALGRDAGFDSLDRVVRAVLRELTIPGAKRTKTGLLALLDDFLERERQGAVAAFDEETARLGASGDLVALSRAYIEAVRSPRREAARIAAWLEGVELARSDTESAALSALAPRTAKHALGELTRLVRALGHSGTLVIFTDGESLLSLPRGRRDDAYTVIRELVDNTDTGRGLVAARLLIAGATELFVGAHSLASLAPLQSRVAVGDGALMTPHRPLVDLAWSLWADEGRRPRRPEAPPASRAVEVRGLIRGAHGLPPTEAVSSLSVGHEEIDRAIDGLFEHSAMEGSVFALLAGAYGSGKTHLLLHLAARALADKRPVLRLSLERLDADLGNPQRHLRRMLDQAELPLPGRPSLLDLLGTWTRKPRKLAALLAELAALRDEGSDASPAAVRVLRAAEGAGSARHGIESILGAVDLESKPNQPSYRQDAYGRLLLWFALLERLEGCAGPVLLIDEAENLYKGGSSRSERRTALRSLAFYCGGALPRACVVLAITPDVLPLLRQEAKELLDEVTEQVTLLTWEDAAMFRRRLVHTKPQLVPALLPEHRELLAARVRRTHAAVRGPVRDPRWAEHVEHLSAAAISPRELVRRTVDRLEGLWWANAGE